MKLDKKDVAILKLLQSDARLTTAEIAEKVNLSQTPCWRRIQQYEKDGLIKGKVHLLDAEQLGMEMVVFTSVNLRSTSLDSLQQFEKAVMRFPEVTECYTMTGVMDYMLKVVTKNIRQYELFVRESLAQVDNIREFHSHVSVTKIKDTTELPLDTQL